jgi:Ca2+-binding EF-hand superfamily protein
LLLPGDAAHAGERQHSQDSHAAQQQLLHFFDRDQSGTIDFNEFVLIVICLSVPEKDIEVVFDVMDLVRRCATGHYWFC